MDLMSIRMGLMMAMANGQLPTYLRHFVFKPSEDTRTMTLNVGNAHNMVFICDCPIDTIPATPTALNGVINFTQGGIATTISRLVYLKTNGTLDYYQSTSAGQSWTYADGILTISTTTGYFFAAGVRYDIFYW